MSPVLKTLFNIEYILWSPTTADPTATPAAVLAMLAKRPGCLGCATAAGGGGGWGAGARCGTLAGTVPNPRDLKRKVIL